MSPNAIVASTNRLTAAATACAWSQWTAIGALTAQRAAASDEIVDVEALVLGSLGLADHEPRLRTLVTDWTVRNSELISIARIRALLEGPFAGIDLPFGDLAHRVCTEGGDARWRAFASKDASPSARAVAERPRIRKASPPRWRHACTLLLQLRRGFGVGVKPDLLAILLGVRGAWVDVAGLVELSRYSVAGVRRAADDMANAGLIETSGGHSRAFRAKASAWTTLFPGLGAPLWRRRADGFAFVVRWQRHVGAKRARHDSELSTAIAFGAQMTASWPLWLEVGVTQEPVSDDPGNAWQSRESAITALELWFGDSTAHAT